MTLILSESEVQGLLDMGEVFESLDEVFRQEGCGQAFNSPRTRTAGAGSVLNVMHAVLPYLGRGGLKAYMSSPGGTKFVVVLFDLAGSGPLAIMGADALGRFRTGAASGVALKHLYRQSSATLALFGSGKQALTQVLGAGRAASLEEVRVWSPSRAHREAFVGRLVGEGFRAKACDSPGEAAKGAQVASSITSSSEAFLDGALASGLSHLNLCGGNHPRHAEITPDGVAAFDAVVVDDLPQAKVEYGDLILASREGKFSWESAVELGRVAAGQRVDGSKTLFKSGGVAIEDVAVASLLYDKALKSGLYDESAVKLG